MTTSANTRAERACQSLVYIHKKIHLQFFSSITMRTSFKIMPSYKNTHAKFTTDKLTPCIILTSRLSTITSNFEQPLITIHLILLYLKSKLVETSGYPKVINQGSLTSTIKPNGYMTKID